MQCTKCHADKTADQYHGPHKQCRECRNEARRIRKAAAPDKAAAAHRKQCLQRRYGLSVEQYADMLTAQSGKCAICDVALNTGNGQQAAHIDHCHTTGRVRKVLCRLCNTGLGQFQDSAANLLRAAAYLKEHS